MRLGFSTLAQLCNSTERIDKLEQLSSNENHAALKSLIGSGYALDLDRAYERGLALMVDGIFSRLARTR